MTGPWPRWLPRSGPYHGRGAFAPESRPPLTTRYVPFARSLSSYSRTRLRTDVIAGVTVAALALPSATAYAELAGVRVSAGLYALLPPSWRMPSWVRVSGGH
jgi:sulfate permease, SulP family